jgi:flagellar biosynthesis GTPase FlhF
MNVKRIVAKTSREAMRQLREVLGPDAVILSNRAVDGGVEVLALAADDIASINVRAAYGDQPQNALLTPAALEARFEWFSQIDAGQPLRDVAMEFEVLFKNVDTTKRPAKLKSKPWTVDIDNVEIVPRELYSLITVPVIA